MKNSYQAWAEAFEIFAKYDDSANPGVSCEEDVIYAGPDLEKVSVEDKTRLETLGWKADEDYDCFYKLL
jgi:hypothetical protein